MREIRFSKEAAKTLARIPRNVAGTIWAKLRQYAASPETLANNVKALKGHPGLLRLRVGDWRVLFTDDGRVIAVTKIAPRGSAYD